MCRHTHLDSVESPGSSQAAGILAGVGVANHALLLALDMLAVPIVAQQLLHGALAVVQIVQRLEQRRHAYRIFHAALALHQHVCYVSADFSMRSALMMCITISVVTQQLLHEYNVFKAVKRAGTLSRRTCAARQHNTFASAYTTRMGHAYAMQYSDSLHTGLKGGNPAAPPHSQ